MASLQRYTIPTNRMLLSGFCSLFLFGFCGAVVSTWRSFVFVSWLKMFLDVSSDPCLSDFMKGRIIFLPKGV